MSVEYENGKIKKINFTKERTKLAKEGLFRTGWIQFKFKGYDIDISRFAYKGKSSYKINASKGKSYDNTTVATLKEVLQIINNIDKYSLTNESL